MRWWNEQGWTDAYQPGPGATAPIPAAPVPATPRVPKVRRRIPLIAAIWTAAGVFVLGLLIGIGSASGGHSTPTNTSALKDQVSDLKGSNSTLQDQLDSLTKQKDALEAENTTLTKAADKEAATAAANTIPGDGTYLVGVDIKPGTYRSTGNDLCYWERDKSADGNFGSIIANDNVTGQGIVTIKSTDKVFTSNNCNDWKRVGH